MYSDIVMEGFSSKIMDLLSTRPQGVTVGTVVSALGWKRGRATGVLRAMKDDGVLVSETKSNPTTGAYPRRLVVYTLAPPNWKPARLGDPIKAKPKAPAKVVASADEEVRPIADGVVGAIRSETERDRLIDQGREMLRGHSIAFALLGEGFDVELAMLRIAVFHLRGSK